MLQSARYNLQRGSGVPLAMDYSLSNRYEALDDASVAVTDVLSELHSSHGYAGDHQSDQTSDKQHLAGFGWGRSSTDVGIEDWGFRHPMQALICSDQTQPAVLAAPCCQGSDTSACHIAGGDLASCTNGVFYHVYDDDEVPTNDLPPMAGIFELRQRCASLGLQPVRITSAEQVDGVLRPMLQSAGYDLGRGSGVPLALDYNLRNTYEALDDATVGVSQIFAELHSRFGYGGDHMGDQTDMNDPQHLAGFGWGRSTEDVGIEDWGFQHPMQALICSDNANSRSLRGVTQSSAVPVGSHVSRMSFEAAVTSVTARTAIVQTLASIGLPESSISINDLRTEVITAAARGGSSRYYVLDSDSNPVNDLPPMAGIFELRQRCADFGLQPVRITSAEQVDGVLRPMLQSAGYDLGRGSGVPLALDYNLRNTYEALDDANVGVSQIFAELHSRFGYGGDHMGDQTDMNDPQHLAGFGWGRSTEDVGIEDWGFQHPMQALICAHQPDLPVSDRHRSQSSSPHLDVGSRCIAASFDVTLAPNSTAMELKEQISAQLPGLNAQDLSVSIRTAQINGVAADSSGVTYYVWDSDSNAPNDLVSMANFARHQ
eukprot:SAG11_NODE_272_length_11319_cov_9.730481_5_plen_600_part_00